MGDYTEEIKVCVGALRPYGPGIVAEIESAVATLTAERDRLAAENAELRKQSDEDMEAFLDMSRIADSYSMQLAAANATLDRLREAWPDLAHSEPYLIINQYLTAHKILYPNPPEAPNEAR